MVEVSQALRARLLSLGPFLFRLAIPCEDEAASRLRRTGWDKFVRTKSTVRLLVNAYWGKAQAFLGRGFRLRRLCQQLARSTTGFVGQVAAEQPIVSIQAESSRVR
jgi:hypothetical protein